MLAHVPSILCNRKYCHQESTSVVLHSNLYPMPYPANQATYRTLFPKLNSRRHYINVPWWYIARHKYQQLFSRPVERLSAAHLSPLTHSHAHIRKKYAPNSPFRSWDALPALDQNKCFKLYTWTASDCLASTPFFCPELDECEEHVSLYDSLTRDTTQHSFAISSVDGSQRAADC